MALRGQTLFQEQGWLGTKLPDVAGCAAPDRKLSFLPVHTHTYTHSRLPAHKCPCKEPNGFPQLGLHAGNPDTFTATAWSAAGAQPRLPLCQDAPTQLWGWFCPVGANLVSLPPLFKTLRAATRPGEGAEHSPAQGSEPWRSLEWARPPWL